MGHHFQSEAVQQCIYDLEQRSRLSIAFGIHTLPAILHFGVSLVF